MLKPTKTKTARASGGLYASATPRPAEVPLADYALLEYGLTPAEMAKVEKRISNELKAARKRGEVKRFTGSAKDFR